MKKLIASLMAIGMMGAACLPAFAEDTTIDQDHATKRGTVNFKYSKSAKYSITIPESVTISQKDTATEIVGLKVNSDNTDVGLRKLQVTVPGTTDIKDEGGSNTVGTLTLDSEKKDSAESTGGNVVVKLGKDKFTDGFGFKATVTEGANMDVNTEYTAPVEFTVALVEAEA